MPRPASTAVAGFYSLPVELVPDIASLVSLSPDGEHAVVDPCAGEGEAVYLLADQWFTLLHRMGPRLGRSEEQSSYAIYACEMEATRADHLKERLQPLGYGHHYVCKGDAFRLRWQESKCASRKNGATVLYLNPPYDNVDREYGRLEERWLRRFYPMLCVGGALVSVVPWKALGPSAETLATHFTDVHCFRFPDPHFAAFSQVVLVARRSLALFSPDSTIDSLVRAWGSTPESIPVLVRLSAPLFTVAGLDDAGFPEWKVAPLDVEAILCGFKPWHTTDRAGRSAPIPNVVPQEPFSELLSPTFPVAVPPKPAHIAAGIASGALSGARVTSTDTAVLLPDLLVKGSFRRVFRTVDQKTNKDGEVTGLVQVQHPELAITALDLSSGQYHTLKSDVAVTGSAAVGDFTVGDLIDRYGPSLVQALRRHCPALYDPARPADMTSLPSFPRALFQAQSHATRAVCKLLAQPDQTAIVLGEVGCGKSTVALAAAECVGAVRPIILCPPHLLKSWTDQARAVVPWARVVVLDSVEAVDQWAADDTDQMVIAVLSREAAKLGHAWEGVGTPVPPLAFEVRDGGGHGPRFRVVHGETLTFRRRTGDRGFHVAVKITENTIDWYVIKVWTDGSQDGSSVTINSSYAMADGEIRPVYSRIAWMTSEFAKFGVESDRSNGSASCSRCGALTTEPAEELARRRVRCGAAHLVAVDATARLCERLALALAPSCADSALVQQLVRGRIAAQWLGKRSQAPVEWSITRTKIVPFVNELSRLLQLSDEDAGSRTTVLCYLLMATADDALVVTTAKRIFAASLADKAEHGRGSRQRDVTRAVLLCVQSLEMQNVAADMLKRALPTDAWAGFDRKINSLRGLSTDYVWEYKDFCMKAKTCDGTDAPGSDAPKILHLGDHAVGSASSATHALKLLVSISRFKMPLHKAPSESWNEYDRRFQPLSHLHTKLCSEPLYQAVPTPRRVPLAHYIAKRYPSIPDLFVVDEAHEYAASDSAQSQAAQQFYTMRKPTVVLTGSVMNGYASSLFTLLWHLSSKFREEFDRADMLDFIRRYGYERQVVELRDEDGTKVSFGTHSDRVERVARTTGQAPGVLPALLLRHLLPYAVTIHIQDLEVDLSPIREIVEYVEPGAELGARYHRLQGALLQQIKRDRFDEELSGRLFGQLAEVPSYLDRATSDVGNCPRGDFEVRYPESVGGRLVAAERGLPPSTVLPKEQWLIDTVRRELAEGRNVMVFDWHVELHGRLAQLLEQATCEPVVILYSDKVQPKKREEWIDRQVISKKRRIMIANPVAVQTGLNNLVYFATEIWMENPACNPIIRRQAVGRVRRLGQKLEARIYTPVYRGTLQEAMHKLLLHKIGVSEAADGLDATAVLQAAGVGEADETAGIDLGRMLYRMLVDGTPQSRTMADATL